MHGSRLLAEWPRLTNSAYIESLFASGADAREALRRKSSLIKARVTRELPGLPSLQPLHHVLSGAESILAKLMHSSSKVGSEEYGEAAALSDASSAAASAAQSGGQATAADNVQPGGQHSDGPQPAQPAQRGGQPNQAPVGQGPQQAQRGADAQQAQRGADAHQARREAPQQQAQGGPIPQQAAPAPQQAQQAVPAPQQAQQAVPAPQQAVSAPQQAQQAVPVPQQAQQAVPAPQQTVPGPQHAQQALPARQQAQQAVPAPQQAQQAVSAPQQAVSAPQQAVSAPQQAVPGPQQAQHVPYYGPLQLPAFLPAAAVPGLVVPQMPVMAPAPMPVISASVTNVKVWLRSWKHSCDIAWLHIQSHCSLDDICQGVLRAVSRLAGTS